MKVWLNNRIVDEKMARVSIFDRGFLYGDGVFETMRSYNGKVFKLDEHLARMRRALNVTGIRIPCSRELLRRQVYKLLKINRLADAYIRITITRGEGTIGLARIKCKSPTIVIVVRKFTPYPARIYKKGIRVKIVKVGQNENSPVSGIKTTSFLNYVLARLEAKKSGFDDAIMLNSKKRISESSVSNIFLVKGKWLVTPSLASGTLPGVTRSAVLKLAGLIGLKIKERGVTAQELYGADEVFLTGSLMEVMPVVRVDDRIIGKGKVGLFTKRVQVEYERSRR